MCVCLSETASRNTGFVNRVVFITSVWLKFNVIEITQFNRKFIIWTNHCSCDDCVLHGGCRKRRLTTNITTKADHDEDEHEKFSNTKKS